MIFTFVLKIPVCSEGFKKEGKERGERGRKMVYSFVFVCVHVSFFIEGICWYVPSRFCGILMCYVVIGTNIFVRERERERVL